MPRSDTATLPLVCKNERIWTLREGARQGCLPASANATSKPSYSLCLYFIFTKNNVDFQDYDQTNCRYLSTSEDKKRPSYQLVIKFEFSGAV